MIESEDKTQQSEIIGNDKESIPIDLLKISSKPITVNAMSGATQDLIRRSMLGQLEQSLQAKKSD